MDKMFEQVKLRNGEMCPKLTVGAILAGIEALFQSGWQGALAVHELHIRAKNPDHRFYGNAEELLKEKALLGANGSISIEVKNIILSCYDEGTRSLISPVVPAAQAGGASTTASEEAAPR
jgi:hypothetical protein